MTETSKNESPLLIPPQDKSLRKQLEGKLKEYEERKAGKGRQWEREATHPKLAHMLYPDYRDACYKADALSAVLKSETPVRTFDLSLKLRDKYAEDFDIRTFENACATVAYYLGNTNSLTVLNTGTGLPPPTK